MSENAHRITDLLIKFQRDEITPEELEELNTWKAGDPSREELFKDLTQHDKLVWGLKAHAPMKKKILDRLRASIPELNLKAVSIQWRYAAAAGLIIAFAGGMYLVRYRDSAAQIAKNDQGLRPAMNDIPAPTGSHTVLTLASGKTIFLDSTVSGSLAEEGGAEISKQGSNQVVYNTVNEKPTAALFNTLSTTKGGQTQIVLGDGSRVWLDASSSIRFPSVFTGAERRVSITGEAYFEIAPNKSVPFIVEARNTSIKVLGTKFNVMAYDDEEIIKTTLLGGSVMVSNQGKSNVLKPAEEARVAANGAINVLRDIDTAQAVAWKNGKFKFAASNLPVVMRQLERWYGITVKYEEGASMIRLSGSMRRDVSLSNVLKVLEMNGARLKVDGAVVTVLK